MLRLRACPAEISDSTSYQCHQKNDEHGKLNSLLAQPEDSIATLRLVATYEAANMIDSRGIGTLRPLPLGDECDPTAKAEVVEATPTCQWQPRTETHAISRRV